MTSDSGTFKKYTKARKSFSTASGTFQSIIIGKGLDREFEIPDNLQYYIEPGYLIDPSTSTSGASLLSSTEQIK